LLLAGFFIPTDRLVLLSHASKKLKNKLCKYTGLTPDVVHTKAKTTSFAKKILNNTTEMTKVLRELRSEVLRFSSSTSVLR
jgi:hypothetical protein